MDYTACALPFAVLLGFLFGVGITLWCMREPKPKQEHHSETEKTLLEQQVDEIIEYHQKTGW